MNDTVDPASTKKGSAEFLKNRWLLLLFFGALSISIFATWHRVFVAQEYFVRMEVVCDPAISSCFGRDVCETEDGICAEGDERVQQVYKIVTRKASNMTGLCSHESSGSLPCSDGSCQAGEEDCLETVCAQDTVPEGETCIGPFVEVLREDGPHVDDLGPDTQ